MVVNNIVLSNEICFVLINIFWGDNFEDDPDFLSDSKHHSSVVAAVFSINRAITKSAA